jgi:hypothetical protein
VHLLVVWYLVSPACFYFHSLHSKYWKTVLGTLLSDALNLLKLPRFSRRGRNHEDGITFLCNAAINLQHSVVSKDKTLQYDPSKYVPPSDSLQQKAKRHFSSTEFILKPVHYVIRLRGLWTCPQVSVQNPEKNIENFTGNWTFPFLN